MPLLLDTLAGRPTPRRPVWIQRQAGRSLPEYRALRARHEFLELCRNPELAAEVTLQPVRRLGVDAAILFADILLPLLAMGVEVRFEEGRGPVIGRPVRQRAAIGDLRRPDVGSDLGYVGEAVSRVRRELPSEVALIGFAASPWTLGCYLVDGGGGKGFPQALAWSWSDPEGLALLLARLATVTTEYLRLQIEAGAEVVQIFDTWAGLLDAERWRRLVRPPLEAILEGLPSTVPVLYYLQGAPHLLADLATLPVAGYGLDWRQPLADARLVLGAGRTLQGNLDPALLLAPPSVIQRAVAGLLAGVDPPHIVNLGHGILPSTPVEHTQAFVQAVRRDG